MHVREAVVKLSGYQREVLSVQINNPPVAFAKKKTGHFSNIKRPKRPQKTAKVHSDVEKDNFTTSNHTQSILSQGGRSVIVKHLECTCRGERTQEWEGQITLCQKASKSICTVLRSYWTKEINMNLYQWEKYGEGKVQLRPPVKHGGSSVVTWESVVQSAHAKYLLKPSNSCWKVHVKKVKL